MKIYHSLDEIGTIKNPVVTTGSFDGVHIGHKTILNRLNELAQEINGESVLISFHPHPRKVLYPDFKGLQLINSPAEKIKLLTKTGLDNLIILPFTKAFAQTSSIDFIRKILVGRLKAKKIVIGFNHHFGHNREGNYEYLYEMGKGYGFEVEEIPEQDIHNESVSSTKIRKALSEGKIQRANAYLDHFYIVCGPLQTGNLFNPAYPSYRVCLEDDCKLIPPNGIYAVSASVNQHSYRGMLCINKPENANNALEYNLQLHLFDPPENLHGHHVCVNFQKQIRDDFQFGSPDEIEKQLNESREKIEELIY